MKRRLVAAALALGLTVSAFSLGAYAEEAAETAEQVTENTEETVSEAESAAEADSEAEETQAGQTEEDSEAEAAADEAQTDTEEAESVSEADVYKEFAENYLSQISAWTDEQVEQYMESTDSATALVASNWSSVASELGSFIEVTEVTDAQMSSDGTGNTVTVLASYDGVNSNTSVEVTLTYDYSYSSTYQQYLMYLDSIEWNIDYPLSVLMQRAAMNTVIGVCIVFCVLLFLSFLIGRLHYLTDFIENRQKQDEPAPAAPAPAPAVAAAPAAAAEPAAEETDPAEDLELVAVITAAIAAVSSEESASGDGYVVRSIKKVNKRNWRRA